MTTVFPIGAAAVRIGGTAADDPVASTSASFVFSSNDPSASFDAYVGGDNVVFGRAWAQYLVDIDEWGYEDARVQPRGGMTEEQVATWTAAIDKSH